ncbi:MAG: hypothetical protein OXC53_07710, partial [Rhodobacteraceae bacterium]|nr:hypothetical protein [Paracoccaceae bacterium]
EDSIWSCPLAHSSSIMAAIGVATNVCSSVMHPVLKHCGAIAERYLNGLALLDRGASISPGICDTVQDQAVRQPGLIF